MSPEQITYSDVAGAALTTQDDSIRGAELLMRCLRAQGVDLLFGYPGGANLELFNVLDRCGVRCIRTEHEQGAIHAAQGYARASGRTGVCLATSGPGATNLVTGIADAFSDSTPVVAITGNVPTHLIGKNSFQEVDICSIVAPITRGRFQVTSVDDIPGIVARAFELAQAGRGGPVLIDIPKDIQQAAAGGINPSQFIAAANEPLSVPGQQLQACVDLLASARRPMIYAGGGIVASDTREELVRLAEQLEAPVAVTIMGLGGFPCDHRLYFGVLGMHGARAANLAVNEADVVLALGVRFDDRVTGNVEKFISDGKIIHVDIDQKELHKNKPVEIAVGSELKPFFEQLTPQLSSCESAEWIERLHRTNEKFPLRPGTGKNILGSQAISLLSEVSEGEAIVTTGVGQHQMWAMQHYRVRRSRSFISSSGFGTMGYGLPAAIGAKLACPDRQVIDIDGDGSLNMTIHELSTCHRYSLGVKIVVINNQWLGMVRQWQDMIYDGHRAESKLGSSAGEMYPDFVTIASGYGVTAKRVRTLADLDAAYRRMLADPDEPYLLDIVVDVEENVYPMIPAGASYKEVIDNTGN